MVSHETASSSADGRHIENSFVAITWQQIGQFGKFVAGIKTAR